MNSSLARPTPAFGRFENLNAISGDATFNIIGVETSGKSSKFVSILS